MAEPDKPGTRDHLELTIISEREKPALDETTFQQLLEAAHVLQEQKTFEVEPRSRPDPTEALAQIVETQEFLRSQAGDLQVAANVIVERLAKDYARNRSGSRGRAGEPARVLRGYWRCGQSDRIKLTDGFESVG